MPPSGLKKTILGGASEMFDVVVPIGIKTISLEGFKEFIDAIGKVLLIEPVYIIYNEVSGKITVKVPRFGYYIIRRVDAELGDVIKVLREAGYVKVAEECQRFAGVPYRLMIFDRIYDKKLKKLLVGE